MVFLTICSVQNVQNDRTNIFGLKISRNTPYGVNSYLSIMISVRIFRRKTCFLWEEHVFFRKFPTKLFLKLSFGQSILSKSWKMIVR